LRIISLFAGATEIVCALDAGEWLVGRSHECDNPEWVRTLPACSEPAFDVTVSSGAIDREVRRRLHAGEPLYRIHADRIAALRPDLIIAQSHCDVCAVTPEDVTRAGESESGVAMVSLSASSVAGVFGSIVQIGEALDVRERAAMVVARERARIDKVREKTARLRRPKLVVLEWTDPMFPMANWGPELVEIANGELVLGRPGEHSSAVAAEQITAADPEYVIVAPCGFSLARAIEEIPVLEQYGWWRDLRAGREGKVAFADGNLFFNRAGMTLARTGEIVAEILHGVVSGERAEGRHWCWMQDVPATTSPAAVTVAIE
jgi:iron complex transport system substrate-binding protein